jgi:hypothetical protein
MELQTKANSVMSDEKIVDLYWQRDEQAIKETDIKYKKFFLSVAMTRSTIAFLMASIRFALSSSVRVGRVTVMMFMLMPPVLSFL